MGKGKNCVVCYREMYESMRQTVFSVIQTICKNYLYSYEELKSKLPDEIASIGPHFMEHPFVIKILMKVGIEGRYLKIIKLFLIKAQLI